MPLFRLLGVEAFFCVMHKKKVQKKIKYFLKKLLDTAKREDTDICC